MTTSNNQPERLDNLQRLELESTIGFEGMEQLFHSSSLILSFSRKSSSWS